MSNEDGAPDASSEPPPAGTVTFLFTDIEGSTRAARVLGDRFPAHLAEHHRILREAILGTRGSVVRIDGDSFFAIFPDATDAVTAAVRAQRGLGAHEWEEDVPIRVRMGLHTGRSGVGGDDYTDVARAARIMRGPRHGSRCRDRGSGCGRTARFSAVRDWSPVGGFLTFQISRPAATQGVG